MLKEHLPSTKLMTIQEVADFFRVHRTTVTRYAKSGELKSYVLGSRRLFKPEDVATFFENRIALEYVFARRNNYGNCIDPEAK